MNKKIIIWILSVLFLIPFQTHATTYTLNQLQSLYPDGASFTDTYTYRYTTDENPNTIVNMVETNCAGFAATLYYKFYGIDHHWATKSTDLLSVEPGDIIRYQEPDKGANTTEGHSVFVIARSGSTVTVAEANYGGDHTIKWGRQCNISEFNYGFDHIDKGLYPIGGTVIAPTVEIPQNVKTSFNVITGKLNVSWTRVSQASDYIVSVFTEQDVKNNNFSNPIVTERPTYNVDSCPTITLTPTQTGVLYVYVQTVLDEYKSSFSSPITIRRVQISSLTIDDKPTGNIYVGDEFILKAIKNPTDANYQTKLTWTSSNENVATVTSNGKVTVVGEGTTTITVESENGIKTGYSFTAMDKTEVESITLNETSKELLKDEEFQLQATILPENLANKEVTWNSSDSSIATVDSTGKVRAISKGTATITATVDEKSATCIIIVSNSEIEEINFSLPFAIEGETYFMRANVTPNDANPDGLVWTSSNSQVLNISSYSGSDAWLEGKHAGTATITIQASNGVKTDVDIKVYAKINNLKVNGPTSDIYVGDTFEMNYEVSADGEYYDYFKLSSSNPDVIEVDGKTLTAKKAGSSVITAEDFTGKKTANTTVVVNDRIPITDIIVNAPQKELIIGQTEKYSATIVPENTTDSKELIWTSSNPSVATIDSNGNISAISLGKTTISVTTSSTEIIKTFEVTVKENIIPVEKIELNKGSLTLNEGESETLIATITPENATDKNVIWTSSNTSVAIVTDGTVIAKKAGTTTITAKAGGKSVTCQVTVTEKEELKISYKTHVQSYGWQEYVSNGEMSGTEGEAKRLEGIKIKLENSPYEGEVLYKTHIQSIGWEKDFKHNNELSGTEGMALRLEAIQIKLDGEISNHYDVYYRVHAQKFGWLGWAKNGESAGTAAFAYRLEGIQIRLVPKNEEFSEYGKKKAFEEKLVQYATHVQSYGWQEYTYDGNMSGTSGEAKRLEAIKILLSTTKYTGAVEYKTHIQSYGWEKTWKRNNEISGTSGEAKRLEAIQIRLTGEIANHYDIYYRVHAQSFGWLAWAKNGEESGTAGYAKRLEAIEIVLVEKGQNPPARDNQNDERAYIENT